MNKYITPKQSRMARAYWGWKQKDLADRAGVNVITVNNFENETGVTDETREKIATAVSLSGLKIAQDGGINPSVNTVTLLEGATGFAAFMDDVYETMSHKGGIYRVSNVNEANWIKWLGDDEARRRRDRITKLNTIKARILVAEGNTLLTATDYAEYRSVPDHIFHSGVSSYIYGDKYAIIHFEPDAVRVMVLHEPSFTEAQICWFDAVWHAQAKERV